MGLAKITIINGRLGADAELKFTQDGLAICSFRVAVDSLRKKEQKKDGTDGKKTYWIRCTLFGKQAEALSKYLLKGTAVYVDGNFDIDDWKTRDGESRYTIECTVDTIQLLSGKPTGEIDSEDYIPNKVDHIPTPNKSFNAPIPGVSPISEAKKILDSEAKKIPDSEDDIPF